MVRRHFTRLALLLLDLSIQLRLVIVIIGQRGVDLGQRQVRKLAGNFLRTPTVRQFVDHDLRDSGICSAHPGPLLLVQENVSPGGASHLLLV